MIPKIAIFASGNGSNAENIIKFADKNPGIINIPVVLTDHAEAFVIQRAQNLERSYEIVERGDMSKREHESAILNILEKYSIDWIFLAGFMRILSSDFINRFYNRLLGESQIINIHPSLLPKYPGLNSYKRAFDDGAYESGVTVHFVDSGVDSGTHILQQSFKRYKNDTLETFTNRGMNLEYKLYVEAIEKLFKKVEA